MKRHASSLVVISRAWICAMSRKRGFAEFGSVLHPLAALAVMHSASSVLPALGFWVFCQELSYSTRRASAG